MIRRAVVTVAALSSSAVRRSAARPSLFVSGAASSSPIFNTSRRTFAAAAIMTGGDHEKHHLPGEGGDVTDQLPHKRQHHDDTSLELTGRKPIRALVPSGQCQFTPEWTSAKLLHRHAVPGGTSYVLRFETPDDTKALGLTTCACVLARAKVGGGDEVEEVIRPYTPISSNDQIGSFDLLIKKYDGGKLSKHVCETMKVGDTIDFKHIDFNVKIPAPFKFKRIGMIAGGTGITPMVQALHAILGEGGGDDSQKSDTEKVTLLYGSKIKEDILGQTMLDEWSTTHPDKLDVVHVLSDEPKESNWDGARGFITKDMIESNLPPPSLGKDVCIFVCGPPPMYNALCGPRDEPGKVTGILGELGYDASQVYKF